MTKKKKITLSILFAVSLLPMCLSQYGGCRGVQEISGLINFFHPIGLISAALFLVGVWIPCKKKALMKALGLCGCAGMAVSELYQFLTWHVMTISGKISLDTSFRFAYPEFYLGLAVSIAMVISYVWIVYKRP